MCKTLSAFAKEDLRGIAFCNKMSDERIHQINWTMYGAQKLLSHRFNAEQLFGCEPAQQATDFC